MPRFTAKTAALAAGKKFKWWGKKPGTPLTFTGTALDAGNVRWSWTRYDQPDKYAETHFVLEISTDGGLTFPTSYTIGAGATTYLDVAAVASTTYTGHVKAGNGWGYSGFSGTATATTPAESLAPGDPGTLSAVAVGTNRIDLTIDNGGALSTDFLRIERSPNGTTGWTEIDAVPGNTTSYSDLGLSPSTIYYYRDRVTNSFGASAYSNTANATTAAVVAPPAAPSNPTDGSITSSTYNVGWTDNSNNEDGFKVEVSLAGQNNWTYKTVTTAPGVTSTSIGSLPASTAFDWRVYAFNSAGQSATTTPRTVTTLAPPTQPPSPPGVPSNLSLVANSATQVTGTFTNNTGAATSIVVLRSDDGRSYRPVGFPLAGNATSFVDRLAIPGTKTYYQLRTYSNVSGLSAESPPVSVTTPGDTTVTAPTVSGLQVYGVDTTHWYLRWNTAGYGETGFEVEQSTNGTTGWAQVATPPAVWGFCTVSGGSAGLTRFFRVRAAVAGGTPGAWSSVVSGATLASGVWCVTGRNPLLSLSPAFKSDWAGAIADYVAAGGSPSSQRGLLYKEVKDDADNSLTASMPYMGAPGTLHQCAVMYCLTGDGGYATKAYTLFDTGNPLYGGTGFSPFFGKVGTVVADAGNSTTQVKLAVSGAGSAVGVGTRLLTFTGANKDTSREYHPRMTAWNATTGIATISTGTRKDVVPNVAAPPLAQAYSAGDIVRLIPGFDDNVSREHFLRFVLAADMLWQGWDATQRERVWMYLAFWADFLLAKGLANYVGGWRLSDSDQCTGCYFGLAALSRLSTALSLPRTDFVTDTIEGGVGSVVPVGGYTTTASDLSSARAAVSNFALQAVDGCWVESAQYNDGTIPIAVNGAHALYTATGSDDFPELSRCVLNAVKVHANRQFPGLTYQAKWGDEESADGIESARHISFSWIASGVFRGRDIGPAESYLVREWRFTQGRLSRTGFMYWYADPGLAGDAAALPTATDNRPCSPRQENLWKPNGWTSGSPCFGAWGWNYTSVDHPMFCQETFSLYRRQERTFRHVYTYSNTGDSDDFNNGGMILFGLSGCHRGQGLIKSGRTSAYLYQQTGQCGENYPLPGITFYDPPPLAVHEQTSSLFYLPSTNNTCDVLIQHWRTMVSSPRKLVKLERYPPHAALINGTVQASPTPTATSFLSNLSAGTNWTGYWVLFTSGVNAGGTLFFDKFKGQVLSASGATLNFAPGVLSAPAAGDTFQVYPNTVDFSKIMLAPALKQLVYFAKPVSGAPTLNSGNTSWTTPGGQSVRIDHHLPSGFVRTSSLLTDVYGSNIINDPVETANVYRLMFRPATAWPTTNAPTWDTFLHAHVVFDAGITVVTTPVQSSGGEAEGALVRRTGHPDVVVLFCARQDIRDHRAGFTASWTSVASTTTVYVCNLDPGVTWTRNLDGGGATTLTPTSVGIGTVSVTGAGSHTLVIA